MLSPGEEFPDVCLQAALRHDPVLDETVFGPSSCPGYWMLYLFLDRSPEMVLAVELAYLISLRPQFEARKLKVCGVMMDADFVQTYLQQCRAKSVDAIPMLTDSERALGRAVGIQVSQRASFLVDPGNRVRYACGYDAAVPRNAFEILRVLDTLNPPLTDPFIPLSEGKVVSSKPS